MSPSVRRYLWASLLAVVVWFGLATGWASSRRSSVWSAFFPSFVLVALSFGLLARPLLSRKPFRFTLRGAAFAISGIGILLAEFAHDLNRGATVVSVEVTADGDAADLVARSYRRPYSTMP